MASSNRTDCIQKRNLLHGPKVSPAELIEAGTRYLEADQVADALDFFLRAGHREGIDRIRDLAVEEGDAFLLARIQADGGDLAVDAAVWMAAAEAALRKEKFRFAAKAYQEAGEEARAMEAEERLAAALSGPGDREPPCTTSATDEPRAGSSGAPRDL